MADDNYRNPMQMNLGLLPGSSAPYGMATPSPGETSLRLMEQSRMALAPMHQAAQAISPMAAANVFQFQFQRQMQQVQQQQSMSPYMAQAYAQSMPWSQQYQGGMLPSPLMMTPPSTGIFRPPMAAPMSPISPMYAPPTFQTPFTPQQTAPMFSTPFQRFNQNMDVRGDRYFAATSQIPNVIGQAAAYAGSAYMGSQIGGAIGGTWGRAIGALGGAALAGFSGFASGVGSAAQMPFQPNINQAQMGAAIQGMSQSWVVTGDQLMSGGRGLSRSAGIDLARGFTDMASNRGFQQETGGMFNRNDLMKMTSLSGQAGLLDMSQSVPAIQQKMREIARNVREFMQLTNDPDVTNVIREMGRMNQFGLSGYQITQAAQNMRTFSRAAGTSIAGLQQMGGLPGAATFQGVGLSAGQGFEYGNFSAALARQSVASGVYSPMQLSMLGGVQGITQRNIQSQAALMSMPLMGAAMSQYGAGGWGVNAGAVAAGGQGGAFGMINQARAALNQGIRQGGVGALAMFPLQQAEVQSQAMAQMTPQEQQMMKYRMAMQTGQRFGMKGEAALAFGAQLMFDKDTAQEMLINAKSPSYFQNQRNMIESERQEVAFRQRDEDRRRQRGMFADITEPVGSGVRGVTGFFKGVSRDVGKAFTSVGNYFEDMKARDQGVIIQRREAKDIAASEYEALGLANYNEGWGAAIKHKKSGYDYVSSAYDVEDIGAANDIISKQGRNVGSMVGTGSRGLLSVAGPVGFAASLVSQGIEGITGIDLIHAGQSAALAGSLNAKEEEELITQANNVRRQTAAALKGTRGMSTRQRTELIKKTTDASSKLHYTDKERKQDAALMGSAYVKKEAMFYEVQARNDLNTAARVLAGKAAYAASAAGWFFNEELTDKDITEGAIGAAGGEEQWKKLSPAERAEKRRAVVAEARAMSGLDGQEPYNKLQSEANIGLAKSRESALGGMRDEVSAVIEDLGTKLDLTYNIGSWDVSDKEHAKTFDNMIRAADKKGGLKYKAIDIMGIAVAQMDMDPSSKNKTARREELKKAWLASQGKTEKDFGADVALQSQYLDWQEKMLSEANREENKGVSKVLGEDATINQGLDYIKKTRALRKTEQLLSGASYLEDFGFDIGQLLTDTRKQKGVKGYEELGVEAIGSRLTEEQLKNMEAAGGMSREDALLFRQMRKGGKEGAGAKAALERHFAARGRPQGKKVTSATSAGGPEAERLDRSDKSVADMQSAFADFGPAAQDFQRGAKMFLDAMESGWMANKQGASE